MRIGLHGRLGIAALAAALAGPSLAAAGPILVRAGRLVDPASGEVRESVDVLIEADRIRAVGPSLPRPDGGREIDLSRFTVLPGLIDSHTHVCLQPEDADGISPVLGQTNPYRALEALAAARQDLRAGFTTLRDLDNEGADMADVAVRDAIRAGLFEGPRIFVSGWAISITAGHMNVTGLRPEIDRRVDQLAILADGRDAMVAAIRGQVKAGVDFIKIYATGTMRHIERKTLEPLSQLSVEEVRLMVEEARRWRMDVAAHAYGGEGAWNAVAGGVRSIEHGMFLDDRTLDRMAADGVFWSPTMTVYLPEADDDADERAFRERVVSAHRDTFRRAMAKGVKIAFGTDVGSMPHGEGWRELVRMADYGMAPMDVLRSATIAGSELLRREAELGRIAPGYRADLIAVAGEPDRDVAALRDVRFVMIDGRVVRDDR
jgi:imidazolonepropionase-like amidohydrolase